jgi:hypothetical protein
MCCCLLVDVFVVFQFMVLSVVSFMLNTCRLAMQERMQERTQAKTLCTYHMGGPWAVGPSHRGWYLFKPKKSKQSLPSDAMDILGLEGNY